MTTTANNRSERGRKKTAEQYSDDREEERKGEAPPMTTVAAAAEAATATGGGGGGGGEVVPVASPTTTKTDAAASTAAEAAPRPANAKKKKKGRGRPPGRKKSRNRASTASEAAAPGAAAAVERRDSSSSLTASGRQRRPAEHYSDDAEEARKAERKKALKEERKKAATTSSSLAAAETTSSSPPPSSSSTSPPAETEAAAAAAAAVTLPEPVLVSTAEVVKRRRSVGPPEQYSDVAEERRKVERKRALQQQQQAAKAAAPEPPGAANSKKKKKKRGRPPGKKNAPKASAPAAAVASSSVAPSVVAVGRQESERSVETKAPSAAAAAAAAAAPSPSSVAFSPPPRKRRRVVRILDGGGGKDESSEGAAFNESRRQQGTAVSHAATLQPVFLPLSETLETVQAHDSALVMLQDRIQRPLGSPPVWQKLASPHAVGSSSSSDAAAASAATTTTAAATATAPPLLKATSSGSSSTSSSGPQLERPPPAVTWFAVRTDDANYVVTGDVLGVVALYDARRGDRPISCLSETSAAIRQNEATAAAAARGKRLKVYISYPHAVIQCSWCRDVVTVLTSQELEVLSVETKKVLWTIDLTTNKFLDSVLPSGHSMLLPNAHISTPLVDMHPSTKKKNRRELLWTVSTQKADGEPPPSSSDISHGLLFLTWNAATGRDDDDGEADVTTPEACVGKLHDDDDEGFFSCWAAAWDKKSDDDDDGGRQLLLAIAQTARSDQIELVRCERLLPRPPDSSSSSSSPPAGGMKILHRQNLPWIVPSGATIVPPQDVYIQQAARSVFVCCADRGIHMFDHRTLQLQQCFGEAVACHGKTVVWHSCAWIPSLEAAAGHVVVAKKKLQWLEREDEMAVLGGDDDGGDASNDGDDTGWLVGVPHPYNGPDELKSTLYVWKPGMTQYHRVMTVSSTQSTLQAVKGGCLGLAVTANAARGWRLLTASAASGQLYALSPQFQTDFAGVMYPTGYQICTDNMEYLEDEDELDTPVIVEEVEPEPEPPAEQPATMTTTTTTVQQQPTTGGRPGRRGRAAGRTTPTEAADDAELAEAMRLSLIEHEKSLSAEKKKKEEEDKEVEQPKISVLAEDEDDEWVIPVRPEKTLADQQGKDSPAAPGSPVRQKVSKKDWFETDFLDALPQRKQVLRECDLLEQKRMALIQQLSMENLPSASEKPKPKGKRSRTHNIDMLLQSSIDPALRRKMSERQSAWSDAAGSFMKPLEENKSDEFLENLESQKESQTVASQVTAEKDAGGLTWGVSKPQSSENTADGGDDGSSPMEVDDYDVKEKETTLGGEAKAIVKKDAGELMSVDSKPQTSENTTDGGEDGSSPMEVDDNDVKEKEMPLAGEAMVKSDSGATKSEDNSMNSVKGAGLGIDIQKTEQASNVSTGTSAIVESASAEEKELAMELLLLSPASHKEKKLVDVSGAPPMVSLDDGTGESKPQNSSAVGTNLLTEDAIVTPSEPSPTHGPASMNPLAAKVEEKRKVPTCSACMGRMVLHSCGMREKPVDYEAIERAERERKEREEAEKLRIRQEKRRLAEARRREARRKKREEEERKQREEEERIREEEERRRREEHERFLQEEERMRILTAQHEQQRIDASNRISPSAGWPQQEAFQRPLFSPLKTQAVLGTSGYHESAQTQRYEYTQAAAQGPVGQYDSTNAEKQGDQTLVNGAAVSRSPGPRHSFYHEDSSSQTWNAPGKQSAEVTGSLSRASSASERRSSLSINGTEVKPSTTLSASDALAALAGLAESISAPEPNDAPAAAGTVLQGSWNVNGEKPGTQTNGSFAIAAASNSPALSFGTGGIVGPWNSSGSESGQQVLHHYNYTADRRAEIRLALAAASGFGRLTTTATGGGLNTIQDSTTQGSSNQAGNCSLSQTTGTLPHSSGIPSFKTLKAEAAESRQLQTKASAEQQQNQPSAVAQSQEFPGSQSFWQRGAPQPLLQSAVLAQTSLSTADSAVAAPPEQLPATRAPKPQTFVVQSERPTITAMDAESTRPAAEQVQVSQSFVPSESVTVSQAEQPALFMADSSRATRLEQPQASQSITLGELVTASQAEQVQESNQGTQQSHSVGEPRPPSVTQMQPHSIEKPPAPALNKATTEVEGAALLSRTYLAEQTTTEQSAQEAKSWEKTEQPLPSNN